jgi:hypothetical protein
VTPGGHQRSQSDIISSTVKLVLQKKRNHGIEYRYDYPNPTVPYHANIDLNQLSMINVQVAEWRPIIDTKQDLLHIYVNVSRQTR